MQEDENELKQPIEMTSDELLDYVMHPEVAEKLKARTRKRDPCEPEETD